MYARSIVAPLPRVLCSIAIPIDDVAVTEAARTILSHEPGSVQHAIEHGDPRVAAELRELVARSEPGTPTP